MDARATNFSNLVSNSISKALFNNIGLYCNFCISCWSDFLIEGCNTFFFLSLWAQDAGHTKNNSRPTIRLVFA